MYKYYIEYFDKYNMLHKATFSAEDDWDALRIISERLNIPYMDPERLADYLERYDFDSIEDVIATMTDSHSGYADFICLIENRTTGEICFEDDSWINDEVDWDNY